MSQNLFSALRNAFPVDLDGCAIETADGEPLSYRWRDIDRATAMLANLLDSLNLPAGARVAVQTEKSVEALMLYLAVLRAGLVYLPLNTAYQAAEIEYFIGNAEPSVVVCSGKNFGWFSQLAFKAGTVHVFTLNDDRSGSLLQRAAQHSDRHTPAERTADDLAAILYTSGTTGRSKGAMLSHGNLLSNALTLKSHWGWQQGDVLIHALPIFHVHGLFVASHGALLSGSKMIWFSKFDPKAVLARAATQSDHFETVQSAPDDLAAILYTSGTTGRSKGAMLTHGNLLSNALVLKDYWGWKAGDVLIHALPIFHVHGLFVASHGALLNGSKMIWFAKFDPRPPSPAWPRPR